MLKTTFNLLATTVVAGLSTGLAYAEDAKHWTYEGAEGPEHWGDVVEDAEACAIGAEQSPVDLVGAVPADAPNVEIFWNQETDWTVINNGHTVQVEPYGPAGHIVIDSKQYDLAQFHFHHPSEHAIDGQRSPMEVHFVHKAVDGSLAVLGVMMVGGGAAGWFDDIMATAPAVEGDAPLGVGNPSVLLPESQGFFRYFGSLTTPPCSEVVLWTVLKDPIVVSDPSLAAFEVLFESNSRPLQPVNRRIVLSE